jgi:hypothetical protein
VFESQRAKLEQEITDRISPVIQDVSKATTGRGGGGSLASKQELYPTTLQTTRGSEEWFNVPKGIPQPTGTMKIEKAYDAKTGRDVDINESIDYRVVGFSPDSRRVLIETVGGVMKSGDKPLLHDPAVSGITNDTPAVDKRRNGMTPDMIKNNAKIMLAGKSEIQDEDKWSDVSGVKMTENEDGTWTLSGTLNKYKRNKKEKGIEKTEFVEVTFDPVTDKGTNRSLELDLDEYRGAISPIEKGWRIGGESVTSVIDRKKGGAPPKPNRSGWSPRIK